MSVRPIARRGEHEKDVGILSLTLKGPVGRREDLGVLPKIRGAEIPVGCAR